MSSAIPSHIKPTLSLEPFEVSIPQQEIDDFEALLKLSKLPPETFEGRDRKYGVTRSWMSAAKDFWENSYDWRKTEAKINVFPQFTTTVKDTKIHFVGIFSSDPSAVPLLLLHGWPGSFYEFYPSIDVLKKSASPAFHIIIPSKPGYAFSDRPPLDRDYDLIDVADLMDEFMLGLGLPNYLAIGGDLGAPVARVLTRKEACIGCHLNMYNPGFKPPTDDLMAGVQDFEIAGIKRGKEWNETGRAYCDMHVTRPSTIGHVTAASPLSLLGWLAEKFLDWTDEDPSTEYILEFTTLWWLTETMPSSIYAYRMWLNKDPEYWKKFDIVKPFGFSRFPKDLAPYPEVWIRKQGENDKNLVYYKAHEQGGHFPGFEEPELWVNDIIGTVKAIQGAYSGTRVEIKTVSAASTK